MNGPSIDGRGHFGTTAIDVARSSPVSSSGAPSAGVFEIPVDELQDERTVGRLGKLALEPIGDRRSRGQLEEVPLYHGAARPRHLVGPGHGAPPLRDAARLGIGPRVDRERVIPADERRRGPALHGLSTLARKDRPRLERPAPVDRHVLQLDVNGAER